MSDPVFDVVKKVLVEVRGVQPEKVALDALLVDDLGADSLDAVEIIMSLESHYDKVLDDAEIENLNTVEDVVALVKSVIE